MTFSLLTLAIGLVGQSVDKAAGVRIGKTSGLTYKKFTTENEAVELLLSGRNDGTQFTMIYEFHQPLDIAFDDNFYVYYGIGGHVGYERYNDLNKVLINDDPFEFVFEDRSYFTMGLDAIAGVEYRYLSAPVTIGFDIKPFFNFIGMRYTESFFWDAALSIKYVF